MNPDRRQFLIGTFGATMLAALPAELLEDLGAPLQPSGPWSRGQMRHLLPTVNDTQILIKASFDRPLRDAPTLKVGRSSVLGTMTDTAGLFWQFRATGLQPAHRYLLALSGAGGRPLCDSWELSTFPAADADPTHCRVVFFSCAGGHEAMTFLQASTRNRLLRRALSFGPDAVVANGDHVYWDLLSPVTGPVFGNSPEGHRIAGTFSRSALIFGANNETVSSERWTRRSFRSTAPTSGRRPFSFFRTTTITSTTTTRMT